jgi:hypothetical protein
MKKKLFLLGILVILFAGFLAFRYFLWDTQNTFGRIKIVSSPSAGVFIDNAAVGKTPFEEKYKVGEYMLKLIPEGDATSTASWQGKIRIYKNALTYVNRELGATDVNSAGEVFTVIPMETKPKDNNYGEIYVESDPSGVIVYLDNDEKGVAPLVLQDVLKGDHELSVAMPGFYRRTQKINIDGGYRVNTLFKLAIDPGQIKPTPTSTSSASATLKEGDNEATASASPAVTKKPTGKTTITIDDTPVGFLRVRSEPTVNASESARVKPGETFDVLDEKDGWYKINYEETASGWVSGQYVTKEE